VPSCVLETPPRECEATVADYEACVSDYFVYAEERLQPLKSCDSSMESLADALDALDFVFSDAIYRSQPRCDDLLPCLGIDSLEVLYETDGGI
jgi:hypothetical protein